MRYTLILILLFSANTFASDSCEDHPELDFFNRISGVLNIELSDQAKPMKNLPGNLVAKPSSKIEKITLVTEFYNQEDDTFRALSKEELNSKAFKSKTIALSGESGEVIEYSAVNQKFFTAQELIKAIELTEFKTRANTEWFGGIDVHHIYFEGLSCHEGVWIPFWGS